MTPCPDPQYGYEPPPRRIVDEDWWHDWMEERLADAAEDDA